MRIGLALVCVAFLMPVAIAQEAAKPAKAGETPAPLGSVSNDASLAEMFEAKVRAEWDALKNKDKKAYGELLADDYEGVEVDGRGERNRTQSINDLEDQYTFNYTLERLKVMPLGPDAALVIYEVTMQYPPKAQLHYSRVYISELWVKRAGQWKELHYQETKVK
ncbi:MAG TPA: nuclear transport factor 2 family protein [Bryocella sp.]|nr:nuclear transport factor 2 family protein [Bryocella sp.]